MVPNGAITPAQTTFKSHHWEGSQALLKPVSHFRILPGHSCFWQLKAHFSACVHSGDVRLFQLKGKAPADMFPSATARRAGPGVLLPDRPHSRLHHHADRRVHVRLGRISGAVLRRLRRRRHWPEQCGQMRRVPATLARPLHAYGRRGGCKPSRSDRRLEIRHDRCTQRLIWTGLLWGSEMR